MIFWNKCKKNSINKTITMNTFVKVNSDVWTKKELLLCMWYGGKNALAHVIHNNGVVKVDAPTDDDLEYALEDYIVRDGKCYSITDGREIHPNCDGTLWAPDYVRYRAIKTGFYNWPYLDAERYNSYYGRGSLQKIILLKDDGLVEEKLSWQDVEKDIDNTEYDAYMKRRRDGVTIRRANY